MAEYICREAALKAFKLTAKNPNKDYQRGMQDTIDCLVPEVIADIPAADVQPVKHGRWIAENRDNRGYADCYTCTNCNCYTYTYTLMKDCEYDYCPNCGARMDGDIECQ